MSEYYNAGDFLIFQVESGFGLLRVLGIDENSDGEPIWSVAAYEELFMDSEQAEKAIETGLTVRVPLVSLTNRAFESTQTARLATKPLNSAELKPYEDWKAEGKNSVSDRSIRLMLGLR